MKLNCEKWRELASEYIEGTLAEPMAQAMRDHVASCGSCYSDETALRSLMGELSSLPEVDPPMYFHENIMAAVEREQAKNPVGSWWETLLPRVLRTGMGTLVVGGVAVAALMAVVIPRMEDEGRALQAGPVPLRELPGPHREATVIRQEPRLSIARQVVQVPERGQATEFTFWLDNAQQGKIRFEIAGVKNPFDFEVKPNVRQKLQVPYDVVVERPILEMRVTWVVDGVRHVRYSFIPVPREDAEPLPDHQTFALPAGNMVAVAREVSTRYGVPVTVDDVTVNTPITVAAQNETADQVLARIAEPLGLVVSSSRAGVTVTTKTITPSPTPAK